MDAVFIPATFLAGLIRESGGDYVEGLLFGVYEEEVDQKQAQDDGASIPSTETITKRTAISSYATCGSRLSLCSASGSPIISEVERLRSEHDNQAVVGWFAVVSNHAPLPSIRSAEFHSQLCENSAVRGTIGKLVFLNMSVSMKPAVSTQSIEARCLIQERRGELYLSSVALHLTALDISSTQEYNSYRPALHHWSFAPAVVAPEEHVIRLEMEQDQSLAELEAEVTSIMAKEERNLKLAAENRRLEKLLAQVQKRELHLA